jgi:uncharacterized membrane protein
MTAVRILARFGGRLPVGTVDALAVGVLAATALGGLVAAPALPDTLQVHWDLGSDVGYYGVEELSTPLGLAAIPVVGLVVWAVFRGAERQPVVRETLGEERWVLDAALLGILGSLAVTQLLLVTLNL